MTGDRFETARRIIKEAVAARAFPAAVIEAGRHDAVVWREAFGTLTFDADSPGAAEDTIFDLASLTKVLAATPLAMQLVERGRLGLEDQVGTWLASWKGQDRDEVTIRDLLAHTSGLTAYLPFFRDLTGRPDFEQEIGRLPLEYRPRTQAIYSDLGFILLGFILEDAGGGSMQAQFERIRAHVAPESLLFTPSRSLRPRIAPTEIDRWRGRLVIGEVHDENAWALGGVAGHAGLFGTAGAVGAFARIMLRNLAGDAILAGPDVVRAFVARTNIPNSSRALGWDTMLPTSSCGSLMSAAAIGHTGFTGTSIWIDPGLDTYVVLLTNRIHPTRDNEAIRSIRPRLHDAIMAAMHA